MNDPKTPSELTNCQSINVLSLKTAFRVFDCIDGQPATLFHEYRGSRKLPTGVLMETVAPGFHVYSTVAPAYKFAKRYNRRGRRRILCRVWVSSDLCNKPNSKVLLTSSMLIDPADWAYALQQQTESSC